MYERYLTVVYLVPPGKSVEHLTRNGARMSWSDAMTERAELESEVAKLRADVECLTTERDEREEAAKAIFRHAWWSFDPDYPGTVLERYPWISGR